MHNSLFTVLGLILLNAGVFAQSLDSNPVLRAESARFEAMIRRDTLQLQHMLAEDLVYIHSNGLTENKKEHIGSVAARKIEYLKMDREKAQVRNYAKLAIVNGIIHVNGTLNKTPFDVRMQYTAVYQKKRHSWSLLNWQSTRI